MCSARDPRFAKGPCIGPGLWPYPLPTIRSTAECTVHRPADEPHHALYDARHQAGRAAAIHRSAYPRNVSNRPSNPASPFDAYTPIRPAGAGRSVTMVTILPFA